MHAPRSSRAIGAALVFVLAACGGRDAGDTDTAAAATDTVATAATDTAAAAAATTGAFLDPNAASAEQLQAVPGMTPAAAQALVAGRPYADMVAVDRALAAQLPDTAARKAIYAQVWRPIDLNTAKGEEILLIPGVGPRMRKEFEEYRPYPDMAKFRREMGKYVDEAEVARLERYVMIR
jgi:DNA uptake protein ComE-like DNA-binding protein